MVTRALDRLAHWSSHIEDRPRPVMQWVADRGVDLLFRLNRVRTK